MFLKVELIAHHDLLSVEEPGSGEGYSGQTEAEVGHVDNMWVRQTAEAGDHRWTMQVKAPTHPQRQKTVLFYLLYTLCKAFWIYYQIQIKAEQLAEVLSKLH